MTRIIGLADFGVPRLNLSYWAWRSSTTGVGLMCSMSYKKFVALSRFEVGSGFMMYLLTPTQHKSQSHKNNIGCYGQSSLIAFDLPV